MQSLDRYQAFFAAAKYENFTKAATELMVSQSAISQAIRQLEDVLEIQLFHRTGRRVHLSPDGRFLYEQLQPVFERLEQTERLLKEEQDPEQARLIIGASDTLCRHYLLDSFEAFHRSQPKVRLEIVNAPSPQIAQLVRNNQVDVGFVHGIADDFADLTVETLRRLEEVFFTKAGSPYQVNRRADLFTAPFVGLTKRSATRQLLDQYFSADQTGWKPQVEVISIDLMIDLVRTGFGISYTHRELIASDDFQIFDFETGLVQRNLLLLQPKTRYPAKTLQHFRDFLKRV